MVVSRHDRPKTGPADIVSAGDKAFLKKKIFRSEYRRIGTHQQLVHRDTNRKTKTIFERKTLIQAGDYGDKYFYDKKQTEKQARVGRPWPPRGAITSANLVLPAGGIRRPHAAGQSGAACGSTWSLGDIVAQNGAADIVSAAEKDFTAKENFSQENGRIGTHQKLVNRDTNRKSEQF